MPTIQELLNTIAKVAKEKGHSDPFIVGGTPRDKLLGRPEVIDDLDITTGDETVHALARDVHGVLVSHGSAYKVLGDGHAQVTIDGIKFDFSSNYRAPGIKQMLARVDVDNPNEMLMELLSRDFTCNALLLTLDLKTIKDPTGLGINDIKLKRIRTCLPARITLRNDTKRVVRVLYLAAKLGFDVHDEIIEWVKKHPETIADVKPKYLSDKLSQAVNYDKERTVQLLDEMGLWDHVPMIPGLAEDAAEPKRVLALRGIKHMMNMDAAILKEASSTKIQKAVEHMRQTGEQISIVQSARGVLDSDYKNWGEKQKRDTVPAGLQRVDIDVRPIGNLDAIFKNYDYAGEDKPGPNKPSLGMYIKQDEYDGTAEYIKKERAARLQRIASKKKKRVDRDIRPFPSPAFRNFDYTSEGPNETSPGGSPYHGIPAGGEKSMGDWIKKRRKALKKRNKKLLSFIQDETNKVAE